MMIQQDGWQVGRARITPVYETDAGTVLQSGLRDATPEKVAEIGWLAPRFADATGRLLGVVQSFVITLDGATVLVDTCVGNRKPRPGLPAWSSLATDFLQRLCAVGVQPADVDTVVCTHLHFDHVGWNTVEDAGRWVPLFSRARHLLCAAEFEYWTSAAAAAAEDADDLAGVADSVLPVFEAGLVDLVADSHEIHPGIRLLPTAGHTPGHVSVLLESAGERAVISGDAIHHACQIARPDWGIFSDFDPARARRTRAELLGMCADTGTLLIGTHFPPPTAVRVVREGTGFTIG
jgi:glyoxylase-like metal-dependent hydrolase (beta-lactamase superfamily II)